MVEECNEITFQWTYDNMNLQRLVIILTLGLAMVMVDGLELQRWHQR